MVSSLFKYCRKLIVSLMLMTFLVQTAMATVMPGNMAVSQSSPLLAATNCHEINQQVNIDLVSDLADCCQSDCHCSMAHCNAALLFGTTGTSNITSFLFIASATIASLSAPYLPSPYRPPITR